MYPFLSYERCVLGRLTALDRAVGAWGFEQAGHLARGLHSRFQPRHVFVAGLVATGGGGPAQKLLVPVEKLWVGGR